MPNLSDHIPAELHEGIRAGTTTLLVIPAGGIEPDSIMLRHRIVEDEYRVKFAEPESLDSEWITCPFRIGSTHYIEGVGRIRVTANDCKRLQEVGEEEALKAGVREVRDDAYDGAHYDYLEPIDADRLHDSPEEAYAAFRNAAYGDWQANPTCWYVAIEKEGGSDGR